MGIILDMFAVRKTKFLRREYELRCKCFHPKGRSHACPIGRYRSHTRTCKNPEKYYCCMKVYLE